MIITGCLCLEISTASAYATHAGLQKLLDDGSDGFCTIDLRLGTICDASPKMVALCGRRACAGRFVDMLSGRDRQAFTDFVNDGMRGELKSMLVSRGLVKGGLAPKGGWERREYSEINKINEHIDTR